TDLGARRRDLRAALGRRRERHAGRDRPAGGPVRRRTRGDRGHLGAPARAQPPLGAPAPARPPGAHLDRLGARDAPPPPGPAPPAPGGRLLLRAAAALEP